MISIIRKMSSNAIGAYFLWFTIHLVLLISLERTFSYKKEFWPIETETKYYIGTMRFNALTLEYDLPGGVPNTYSYTSYDYTEFLIYTIVPILLILGITIISKKDEQSPLQTKNYDESLDASSSMLSNDSNIKGLQKYSGHSAVFNLSYLNNNILKKHNNLGYLMFRNPEKYGNWGFVIKGCDDNISILIEAKENLTCILYDQVKRENIIEGTVEELLLDLQTEKCLIKLKNNHIQYEK